MPFLAIGCVVLVAFFGLTAAFVFMMPASAPATPAASTPSTVTTTCGVGVDTLVPGYKMMPLEGKLGHEQHLTRVKGGHYNGTDSNTAKVGFAGGGAFAPHTQDQERWYINSQWGGWDWSPTMRRHAPIFLNSRNSRKARKLIRHSRIIVTSVETGRSVVTSAEESGPALWVTERDGVNFGAPPEVYKALGTKSPYTGNPGDNHGRIKVQFAQDQNTPLGPCKK